MALSRNSNLPLIPPASGWTGHLLTLAITIAILPMGIAAYLERGAGWLLVLLSALATILIWQGLFALIRERAMPLDGLATALAFSVVLPADLVLWQAVLAMSFGIVAGEQIFGGRGYNFLHPAVAALAFLIFSFPGTYDGFGEWSFWAVLPGAAILLLSGLLNWRVVLAGLAGFIVIAYTGGMSDAIGPLMAPAFAFGLVFFAGDPSTSSATNSGRVAHGAMFGVLVALFSMSSDAVTLQPVVFAALLASVFAPLIDQVVIWISASQRRRRHG